MSGFIAMSREVFDHHLLQDGERFRAWFWLVANACWKPSRVRIKGETIDLRRGELTFSQRFLAEKWGWSKSRVDRFIADLRNEGMIETRSKNGATTGHKAGQGQSIISICNYDKYQTSADGKRGNSGAEGGATAGQQRGKEEQGNKETRDIDYPPTPHCDADWPELPDWLPAVEWNAWLDMRKDKRKWPTPRAIELTIGKLSEWRANGHDPGPILDTATENNWTTVYEPKGQPNGSGNQNPRGSSASRGERDNRSNFARSIDDLGGFHHDQSGQSAQAPDGHATGAGGEDREPPSAQIISLLR